MTPSCVPFKSWHYGWLGPSAEFGAFETVEPALRELERQNSWTGVVDGQPIICAGTIQQWGSRHIAWAYLSLDTGPHMRWITRQVLRNLAGVKGRIESTVRMDFEAGHRWAKLLGFHVETPCMKAYGPHGEDFVGYVRIN